MEDLAMTDATLSASLEDYLETIYRIVLEKQAARAKDIADRLRVHRSSVTNALRALSERSLINYAPYDIVTLTDEGRKAGADIARRHDVLKDFFVKVLAIEPKLADTAACQMEHAIPKAVFQRFIEFVDYIEVCPRGGTKWIKGFGYYCTEGCDLDDCERCVAACLEEVRERKCERQSAGAPPPASMETFHAGQRMRIRKLRGKGEMAQRLRTMGLTPGAVLEVERIAPLGDPVDVKVRGYHLSLRKEDLAGIEVEPLAAPARKGKNDED
jgi:DtxR family transcriptional regulator, Mn-dependent transcriptional regulator